MIRNSGRACPHEVPGDRVGGGRKESRNERDERRNHGERTLPEPRIDLEWWPPDGDEAIGERRAAELVASLRQIPGPAIEEAVADLQARLDPGTEIVRSAAPAPYIARFRFADPQVRSLQLHRDGRLTWRRN